MISMPDVTWEPETIAELIDVNTFCAPANSIECITSQFRAWGKQLRHPFFGAIRKINRESESNLTEFWEQIRNV